MKTFIRIKKIHGHEYAYEITPYYDKKTKKIRQKSKYLGKYENGKIIRVHYKPPRRTLDYGEFLPYIHILNDLKINKILMDILPENMAHIVITLALNRLVYPLALDNIKVWYERTFLDELFGNLSLSSQNLSRVLEKIGEGDVGVEFSERFVKSIGCNSGLIYDITSLSSHSNLIDILEYGYNRDGENLPQINLSIVAHKDLGIPVMYDIYPGSIVDVSTLHNTIERMRAMGINDITLILDRGFFSSTNLNHLMEMGYDFIVGASFSNKSVKSSVLKLRRYIERGKYLHKFNGRILFVKDIELDIGPRRYNAYVYYDPERGQSERAHFYGHLHDIIERLEGRVIRKWEEAGSVVEDIAGKFSVYLRWSVKWGRLHVSVRDKAVSQRVNRMGFMVLVYNGDYGWDEVLGMYKERELVEKMFRSLKDDISGIPLRVQKSLVVKGMIFVNFLALILRFRLLRMLKSSGLMGEYSIPKLILELSKVKRVVLADGERVTTEVTRRQREIVERLGLSIL